MGLTLAMEFNAGKIMSQDMEGINSLDWDSLLSRAGGRDAFIEGISKATVIGQGHWALMPHMTNYWKRMITDIFPNISKLNQKFFFVDPADIQKRKTDDVRDMLFTLKKINEQMKVVLSVNDRETIDVANALSIEGVPKVEKGKIATYYEAGKNINKILGLKHLVIHDPHFASITGSDSHYWVSEGPSSKPKFTTAAGDHFNGGVLLGLMAGFSPGSTLALGNTTTSIFVRSGKSANMDEIKQFLEHYFDYLQQDITVFPFPK